MICGNCGTENRPGRLFCSNCGNGLAVVCANCGTENEPNDRFCGRCGLSLPAAIEPSSVSPRSEPATQRRLVTVLFADLVGFTPFAEERDAEDVRATLESYSGVARAVVLRYGGTVEKFIGDAVMAVWGTPTAHEDDAERAVRAALELIDSVATLGPELSARAGVLTGEAAVDLAARDQSLLAGDLVNTAARLQSVAVAGSVLVGESTMRAASTAVAFEDAGEQLLKGKSAPVAAWRALRVIAQRGGAGRTETVETPFVGRDEEFRRLREQLPLRGRDQRVSLVSVTGPAGIGKSRLAWELEKYIDGVAENIYWHRGRCPAYGDGVSFWALGEMVRRRAGLSEGDDEATSRQRVRAAVDQYVGDPAEREWIEQSLLALLAVEQPAQPTATETLFAAWRRFFENVAAHGPTVLVFEDLHWADDGLLDFIDHVLDWSRNVPILIVTLARPELFDRRPDWGAGRRSFTALALDPLAESDMTAMLETVAPDLDGASLGEIVGRADGIPLYAVEFLRMLVADGRLVEDDGRYRATGPLGTLAVPGGLRSLITARLDALPADDRRLVQDASVLGQTFTQAAVAGISAKDAPGLEAQLRGLVRRELLGYEADPRSPERGQYTFTQSLIREVAYSTLARAERRQRHLAAARYLESVGGDELAPMLAGQYLAAHEASVEGPERDAVAAQARVALRGAAERAASLGGHKQAAGLFAQALAVTTDPTERARLLEQQANSLFHAGRYVEAEVPARAAADLYKSAGDASAATRARGRLGPILINQGRIEAADLEIQAALAELPADGDRALRADLLAKLGRIAYRLNDPKRAMALADEALVIAEHDRLIAVVADAMVVRGTALSYEARTLEAMTTLRGAFDLALRVGAIDVALRAANNVSGHVSDELGARAANELVREAIALARSAGDTGHLAYQLHNLLLGTVFGDEPIAPVVEEAEELASRELAPIDRREIITGLLTLRAYAGDDVTQLMTEAAQLFAGEKEPQEVAEWAFVQALTFIALGEWAKAAQLAARATELRPDMAMTGTAVMLSAVDGDAAAAHRYAAQAAGEPVTGRWDELNRAAGAAALLALDGNREEGGMKLRESLRRMRDFGSLLECSLISLAMLRLLGSDVPDIRASAEHLIAELESVGAQSMVRHLRTALEGQPSASTASRPAEQAPQLAASGPASGG